VLRPRAQQIPPSTPEDAVKGKTRANKPPKQPKLPRVYPEVERVGKGRGSRITVAQIEAAKAAGTPLDQIEPKVVLKGPKKPTPEQAKAMWDNFHNKHKPGNNVFPDVYFVKDPPPSNGDPSTGMLDKILGKRDGLVVPEEVPALKLPKTKERGDMARVVTAMADTVRYEQFLLLLKSGASLAAAGGSLRLTPETIHRWYEAGRQAKKGPYRRFFKDVTAALQEATSFAEVAVKQDNPIRWLERGPGKYVNPEWRSGEMEALPTSVNIHGDVGNKLVIEAQDYQDALRVVHEAGIPLESLFSDHSTRKGKPGQVIEGEVVPALPGPPSRDQNPTNPNISPVGGPVTVEGVQFQQSLQEDDAALCDPDADEIDEVTADNKGVNYTENGRWKSTNPCIPKRFIPGKSQVTIDEPPASTPEKSIAPPALAGKKPLKSMKPPTF